jgi:hypothetical protein
MITCEILSHWRPHITGLAVAMQQDDCRTCASDANVDRNVVGLDLPRLKAGRERLNLRGGGQD